MNTNEVKKHTLSAYKSLQNKRIHDAITIANELVVASSSWNLTEDLNKLKLEYQYLLQYFSTGANDPNRDSIYNNIIFKLYKIIDEAQCYILSKEDYSLYYGLKRTLGNRHKTISQLLTAYKTAINDIQLYKEVDEKERNQEKENALFKVSETLEIELFNAVWISFPQSNEDIFSISQILESEEYPIHFKTLIISAIILSLLHYYNEALFIILLKNYDNLNVEISIRSLCAVIIVLFYHNQRITDSKEITITLNSLLDNPQFADDFQRILLQFIRSKNTEKITKKVEEVLIPKIMKMYPEVLKKFRTEGTSNIDLSDLESNPQWKEIMDNEGISKKIEEINQIQMEGGDVFIGTFSHLKSFPFFNETANWFLPFHKDHSSLKSIFNEKELSLIDIVLESKFFCDSDKYSFVTSMASVPSSQRNAMLSQFDEQNAAVNELKNSELPKVSKDRTNISNLYIQNLYRFFKLYPRKNEFEDPFKFDFDITKYQYITSQIDLSNTMSLIAEFYLKNEYYNEAIKYFSKLNADNSNPIYMQKIGFCYQNLEQYNNAIDFYKKYELYSNNDLWNLRHLAVCYRALKQHDNALKYYKAAEDLAPENISIALNIGHCLLELEQYDEALKYYFKVYYLESDSSRTWRPIAWCYFMQGNYEQSKTYYNKILDKNPSAIDFLNYGHLLFAQKDIPNAINIYKNAINASNSIQKFIDDYNADKEALIKSGINNSEISILLDALLAEMNK